ncbi:uncharacterized protein FMAN_03864 [Fusarium mangiferae]|uniref:Uncharacterized protein n=1 Tax=Fusarium mangiferae TaxID=192010 RepID=A0A1L7U713_FUSMA|nr:uncharacterized protein FMAN_03864 [Fusarium mangiferae]CVL06149.1 uncharacterized protein FMAN_03864 [Fusarium mangiferae]
MTKAEKEKRKSKGHEVPYRKDGFICKRRIRPYTRHRDLVGMHACWHCSLSSLKTQAEEDLQRLLADENRTEMEVERKRNRIQELKKQIMDTGRPQKEDTLTLPKQLKKALEWLGKRHPEVEEQPKDPSASPSADLPTTSDREPSLPAATNKGKGKAVAKTGVLDVPSEASRSSPFPGADRTSDAEMEDADSNEVAATEPADETALAIAAITSAEASRERAEVISALRRFWRWSDRL